MKNIYMLSKINKSYEQVKAKKGQLKNHSPSLSLPSVPNEHAIFNLSLFHAI